MCSMWNACPGWSGRPWSCPTATGQPTSNAEQRRQARAVLHMPRSAVELQPQLRLLAALVGARVGHLTLKEFVFFVQGHGAGVDLGEAHHTVLGAGQLEEADALGVAAGLADLVDEEADDHALLADEQAPFPGLDELEAHHLAVADPGADVDDARAAPALEPVVLEEAALAIALLADREQHAVVL